MFTTVVAVAQPPKQYTYKVVRSYPHSINAYTQGLFFYNGALYESSGQYGYSNFKKSNLSNGKILQILNIPRQYFAEGACVLNNKIYVLTWQEHKCFVYDVHTFREIGTFQYPTEGWGLTTDGKQLIMSDGSEHLYIRDPNTFAEIRRITVTNNNRPLRYLNELEYINGEIWANVYTSNYIVRINPDNGKVTGVIDLANLLPRNLRTSKTDVLNGIAYDEAHKRIVVTGKNWSKMYEITLQEK
ncbi:MAG: glutaminyl-peptide cyclotransferase [Prevotellaceae bacterium]|nr:glutaminyl-peptide cyclotransferase [Prevotellaceae bacterium]